MQKISTYSGRVIWKIMKLSMLQVTLAMIFSGMALAHSNHAQGVLDREVNLRLVDVTLKKVLNELESAASVKFVFSINKQSKLSEKVLLEAENRKLGDILDELLSPREISFFVQEDNDYIVLTHQKDPETVAVAPDRINDDIKDELLQVSGTVTDASTRQPMAGVSIVVKGTINGTTTDASGRYVIEANEDAVLVFSFIGYRTVEEPVNNRTVIDITLSEDVETLSEVVVVSTGYQNFSDGRATGSFDVLKGDEITKVAGVDYRARLEGLVPGLVLGRSSSVTIRGQGTFSANRAPLVIVDGVPVEGADYKLNPDDIAQVTVLKDAAAASIWGIRSANGVIVINTKRGNRTGKTSVSYSSFTSVEEKVNLDDLHRLPSEKYAWGEWNKYMSFGTGLLQPYSFVTEIGKIYNDLVLDKDTAKAENLVAQLAAFDNRRQIEDLFYRNETMTNHSLSVQTGNAAASHYFSVNHAHNQSFQVGDRLNRFNFVSNSDFGISKNVKLQFGTRGNFINAVNNSENVNNIKPYIRILDENGNYVTEHITVAQAYKELLMESGWKNWNYNRLQELRNNDQTSQSHTYAANLRLDVQPFKGFTYTLQGTYEKGFQRSRNLYNEKSYYTRNLVNQFLENANMLAPEPVQYHLPKNGGILEQSHFESNAFDFRNQVEYATSFQDVQLNVLAGHEIYHYSAASNFNRYFGYNEQALVHTEVDRNLLRRGVTGYNAVQDGTFFLGEFSSNSEQIERYMSYYSTLSANYKNKYDVFASARLDKTNLLVNADRYRNNPSWSAGAKWSISQEDFFQASFVSNLAVKASYGVSGNIDKSTAPDMIGSAGVSRLIGVPVLYITNPENKELGWEKTYVLNLGVDFSLWRNRLSGSIEYYNKDGRELLYNITLDPTLGWPNVKKNASSILNRGVDLQLRGQVLAGGELTWDAALNFSYNYNTVKNVNYTPTLQDILGTGSPLVGHPLNYIAVVRYMGLDENGDPIIMSKKGGDQLGSGNLKEFTVDDYLFEGRKDPPIFGSFTNNLQYKAWRLELFFTYKMGHKFLLPTFQNSIGNGPVNEWSDPDLTWQESGDEETKPYPRLVNGFYSSDVNYIVTHNQTLVDRADIVRLRTVSLEYDLGKAFKKSFLKGGSLRLSAENLWRSTSNKYDLDTDYVVPATGPSSSSIAFPARKKFVLYIKFTI